MTLMVNDLEAQLAEARASARANASTQPPARTGPRPPLPRSPSDPLLRGQPTTGEGWPALLIILLCAHHAQAHEAV